MKWGFNIAHTSGVGYSTARDQKLHTNYKIYNVQKMYIHVYPYQEE